MRIFILIWLGQVVSLIGSGLTSFALDVWVYQNTQSITQFALLTLCIFLPSILISPLAGVFIDRWSRRWTMIISDFGAGLSTLSIAWLYASGNLEIWQIYLATIIGSTLSTFQWTAYSASTVLMVSKENLGRASGLIELAESATQLISPVLAAVLLNVIQLKGVILIDFITLLFALFILLIVSFPELNKSSKQEIKVNSIFSELMEGWTYLKDRPGLLGLTVFLSICTFFIGFVQVLQIPLILSFTSVTLSGTIVSIGSSGMMLGGLFMTTWGGAQRQTETLFLFMLIMGVSSILAGLRPSPILFTIAFFFLLFAVSIINSSLQVIFQRKVAPEMQGRVFAFRTTIIRAAVPLAYLTAGPITDQIFEPLMKPDGLLGNSIGQFIGTGTGRGIGLIYIITGLLVILVTIIAFQFPHLRQLEEELPDTVIHEVFSPILPAIDEDKESQSSETKF